jgi:hypothetical protein
MFLTGGQKEIIYKSTFPTGAVVGTSLCLVFFWDVHIFLTGIFLLTDNLGVV